MTVGIAKVMLWLLMTLRPVSGTPPIFPLKSTSPDPALIAKAAAPLIVLLNVTLPFVVVTVELPERATGVGNVIAVPAVVVVILLPS